jgi:hypothetical protein
MHEAFSANKSRIESERSERQPCLRAAVERDSLWRFRKPADVPVVAQLGNESQDAPPELLAPSSSCRQAEDGFCGANAIGNLGFYLERLEGALKREQPEPEKRWKASVPFAVDSNRIGRRQRPPETRPRLSASPERSGAASH